MPKAVGLNNSRQQFSPLFAKRRKVAQSGNDTQMYIRIPTTIEELVQAPFRVFLRTPPLCVVPSAKEENTEKTQKRKT